jgi:hypothetical protein
VTPQAKLQGFLRDLLTLEVSTLVVDQIPDYVVLDVNQQLEGLAKQWERASGSASAGLQAPIEPENAAGSPAPLRNRFRSIAAARGARSAVRAGLPAGLAAPIAAAPPEDIVTARAQLLATLLPPSDEEIREQPEEKLLAIRRIAALGAHPIALHTMLSVNGDLVNLVAKEFSGPDQADVRALHAEGVQHALGWWRTLSQFVVDCLGTILGKIQER